MVFKGNACKENAYLGRYVRGVHHIEDSAFKGNTYKGNTSKGKACSGKACKANLCNGKVCNNNACNDNAVRIMHVMVWNVREIHIWAEISGQGTIWQGT
jgi:hypothetical protein